MINLQHHNSLSYSSFVAEMANKLRVLRLSVFEHKAAFSTFGLKIFTRINNQISKIILSEQIFNLKSESDLRFCISLDSDSCNNRISIKSELSQDFEIK